MNSLSLFYIRPDRSIPNTANSNLLAVMIPTGYKAAKSVIRITYNKLRKLKEGYKRTRFAALWQNEATSCHSESRQQTMSKKIVELNEEVIKSQLKELIRASVEETLNELLEQKSEMLT